MGKQRKTKNIDLTVGNITSSLWKFAVPLMLGNVLQQLYNLVDTWVVGHYIGDNALAAVGSSSGFVLEAVHFYRWLMAKKIRI